MNQQKASYKVGDFYNALFLAWEDLFPELGEQKMAWQFSRLPGHY
jgi:hypothetical protein